MSSSPDVVILGAGVIGLTLALELHRRGRRARERGHEFELLPKPIHPTQLIKHLRQ